MGLLGDLYSTIDSTKRKVRGLLDDPVETAKFYLQNLNEDAGKKRETLSKTFNGEDGKPFSGPMSKKSKAAVDELTGDMVNAMVGAINFRNAPKNLYHGSAGPIDRFDANRLGSNTKASDATAGFHFSDNMPDAGFYADMAAKNAGLASGYVGKYDVSMKRPLVITPFAEDGNARKRLIQKMLDDKLFAAEYAKKNGFDGLIYPHGTNVDSGYTAVAFNPEQIARLLD